MCERDDRHLAGLRQLEGLQSLDPAQDPPVEDWWWEATEAEREFSSDLSAAAAARFDEAERLFGYWRRDASTDNQRRYVEDLIARVLRHLRSGTGARMVDRTT